MKTRGGFKAKPLFVWFHWYVVDDNNRATVLLAFVFGWHTFVERFGYGFDFLLAGPQHITGLSVLKGLHYRKVLKTGLDK